VDLNGESPSSLDVRALLPAFLKTVGDAKRILIGTHVSPDGDALGSALAVYWFLNGRGIDCEIVCAHEPPEYLRFLPGSNKVRLEPQWHDHDLAILVDLEAMNRVGSVLPHFERCPKLILVDHHVPHESPGHMRLVDQSSPATACILARLLFELDDEVTPQIATCLLVGILTDTGSFRYRNTTPESLHQAARLVRRGLSE